MRLNPRSTTFLLTAAAVLAAPGGAAAAAPDCPDPVIEQPFAAFGDLRDYVLAPGGHFSDPDDSGWNLRGGARVDDGELLLREDGSATSAEMCVDEAYPIARFRYNVPARRADDAALRVEVRYPDAPDDDWQKVAKIEGDEGQYIGSGWTLSPDVDMRPHLGGNAPGWRHVQIRLRSQDRRWRIDDVYVDPKRRS